MIQREFLSFVLDDEEYGIPILEVREVRGWNPVRVLPNAPPFVLGLLDIRGEYIPMSLDPELARAAAVGVMVLTPAN